MSELVSFLCRIREPGSLTLLETSDSPYYYPDGSLRATLEARLAVRKLWEVFQSFS